MQKEKYAIGVDLGGTKIAYALVDGQGGIQEDLRHATDVDGGPDAVARQILEGVTTLRRRAAVSDISGVGIGVAGQIEKDSGIIRMAPNLHWHDEPLKKTLAGRLDLPVTVINDVRAATWGEWLHGAGSGCNDVLCVFLGTGIGGGIVSGGRILTGGTNISGEIGHVTVDAHGPACHCGNRGCMEALAGGWAIARRARDILTARPQTKTRILDLADRQPETITAETVIRAHHQGDALAGILVEEMFDALIVGISGIVNTVNPARIILGGGIAEGLPEIVNRLYKGIRFRALASAVENLQVTTARLGNKAGVIGAATAVLQQNSR